MLQFFNLRTFICTSAVSCTSAAFAATPNAEANDGSHTLLCVLLVSALIALSVLTYIYRKRTQRRINDLEKLNSQFKTVLHLENSFAWEYAPTEKTFRLYRTPSTLRSFFTEQEIARHVFPSDWTIVQQRFKDALENKKEQASVVIKVHETESDKCLHYELNFIADHNGASPRIIGTCLDVNLRVEKEEHIKSISREKDLLLSHMPLCLSVFNPSGTLIYTNDAFWSLTGFDKNQCSFTSQFNLSASKYIEPQTLSQILNGEAVTFDSILDYDYYNAKTSVKTNRTGVRYLTNKSYSIRNEKGEISSILIISTDDTDNYLKTKELKKSKLKNKLAIRSSHIAQWEYDIASKTITKVSGEDIISSRHTDDYEEIIHPDDIQMFRSFIKRMDEGMTSDYSLDMRMRFDTEADSWQYLRLTGSPLSFDKTGKPLTYTGLSTNVTSWFKLTKELHTQNELNDIILNNIDIGLVYTDTNGIVIWENVSDKFSLEDTGGKLFTVGKGCFDTHSIFKEPCDECLVFKTLRTMQSACCEKKLFGGKTIEITSNAVLDKKQKNKVVGVVLKVSDISQRKQLYNEIQEAKDKALEASQLLSQLLDRLPTSLFIKDISNGLKYIIANRQFCTLMNMTEDEILNHSDYDLLPKDMADIYAAQDQEAIKAGKAV